MGWNVSGSRIYISMNLIMFSPQKDVLVKAALFSVLAASDIAIAVIRLFTEKTSSKYAEKWNMNASSGTISTLFRHVFCSYAVVCFVLHMQFMPQHFKKKIGNLNRISSLRINSLLSY